MLQPCETSLTLQSSFRTFLSNVDFAMSQLGPALAMLFAAVVFIAPLWFGTPPDLG